MKSKKGQWLLAIIMIHTLAIVISCDSNGGEGECNHTWQWVVTTPASYDQEGLETEKCTLCGRVKATRPIDKKEVLSGYDMPLVSLNNYTVAFPDGGGLNPGQGRISTAMDLSTGGLVEQIKAMNTNMARFESASQSPVAYVDLPNPELFAQIRAFNNGAFFVGASATETMLSRIIAGNYVAPADVELFTAYVNALRGISFNSSRYRDNADTQSRTAQLGFGFKTTNELLENINNLTGEETIAMDGTIPDTNDIRAGAVSLLSNTPESRMLADVITMMGNYSEYMGLIQYVYAVYTRADSTIRPHMRDTSALASAIGAGSARIESLFVLDPLEEQIQTQNNQINK